MKKVLIVDDSDFFRSILRDELERESYTLPDKELKIVEAHNSLSAMQQIKKEQPDLVFLDVVMPESEHEGVNILQKIREEYPSLKVIMLTSVGQHSIFKQCQDLGVEGYLSKPFESHQLNAALKKHLAG